MSCRDPCEKIAAASQQRVCHLERVARAGFQSRKLFIEPRHERRMIPQSMADSRFNDFHHASPQPGTPPDVQLTTALKIMKVTVHGGGEIVDALAPSRDGRQHGRW